MRNTFRNIMAFLMAGVMLLLLTAALPVYGIRAQAAENLDKKACWISFLDMETYLKDKKEAEFRTKVSQMYDKVKEYGMNTVLVHARAMGDAMYPSAYFPWSIYISEDRSNPGYDPLQIMVELAHSKGLQFEAWVNPYRLSRDNKTTVSFKATPQYAQFRDFSIEYRATSGETCLALDPARQEARDLIVNGVREIVENYNVDGIHFDDYFYVSGMADTLDTASRKAHVNALMLQVYQTIKEVKPNCVFGVSPAGNPDNVRGQGADIDTWLSTSGYIDYIMPQIYWSDIYMTGSGAKHMFTDRCKEWMLLNQQNIPIYVGIALYKVGTPSKTDLGWATSNMNVAYQAIQAKQLGCQGYALFRYAWLENPVAAEELANLKMFAF